MSEKTEKGDKQENKETIEVFLQGEGIPEVQLIRVREDGTVRDLLKVARESGAGATQDGEAVSVFIEDEEQELALDSRLKDAGIKNRSRVHVHRCRRVEVTVNFNGTSRENQFPSSKTIAKVKRWADEQFGLKGVDATEHALQISGTSTRPDEDTHVGSLVSHPNCRISFDLVPKKRVEGWS